MSDTTPDVLANAILDALRDSVGEYDTPYIDRSSLTFTCIDGRVDMIAAMDAALAEFLVIPRSEITGTEYGWRADGREFAVPGGLDSAVLEVRYIHRHLQTAELLSRPILPTLPWSVIPLPEDGDSNG